MCGEYSLTVVSVIHLKGSPPRVRGVLNTFTKTATSTGITPACAGSTVARFSVSASTRDHPRVCGEYRGHTHGARGGFGITPACAGSTSLSPLSLQRRWDHPRVCGEYCERSFCQSPLGGSPPRVRGVLSEFEGTRGIDGITPACAGSTE